jgi:hypothetical protein
MVISPDQLNHFFTSAEANANLFMAHNAQEHQELDMRMSRGLMPVSFPPSGVISTGFTNSIGMSR